MAPRVMGVLNVTPDSFADGGRYLDVTAAVEHGLPQECLADGGHRQDLRAADRREQDARGHVNLAELLELALAG